VATGECGRANGRFGSIRISHSTFIIRPSPFAMPRRDPTRLTFPRSHRLKRRRLIRSLFDRRRADVGTVATGCVRLLFRVVPRAATGYDTPIQVGFAPGRRVRNAVARTRVRRLLREVYRVHQHVVVDLFARRPASPNADSASSDADGPDADGPDAADRALIVMILFRGDPARAADQVPRDLPRALRRAADHLAADPAAADR
jgi:ribonuclease P protein component